MGRFRACEWDEDARRERNRRERDRKARVGLTNGRVARAEGHGGRLTPEGRRLAEDHVSLARFLALRARRSYPSHRLDLDELVSVAFESLTDAARGGVPPGYAAKTYFARIIKCDLIDYIRRDGAGDPTRRPVPGPRDAHAYVCRDRGVAACDLHDEVEWVLSRLPSGAREAVRLHYLEGLSLAETGRRLGRVKSRVSGLIKDAIAEAFPAR